MITASCFRKRCYDYESAYGIDPLHDSITGLGDKIAKIMDISPRIKRTDSTMIAANIRKLSRTELMDLKDQLIDGVNRMINGFREKGVLAIYKTIDLLGIKKAW